MEKSEYEFFKRNYQQKKLNAICRYLYNDETLNFNEVQLKIMKTVLYKEHKRILINGHTRFGKSFTMGALIGLLVLFNRNKKIIIMGPQLSQSQIIKKNFSKFLSNSKILKSILGNRVGSERNYNSEISRQRYVFNNGCEVIAMGAQGKAEGILGEGADFLIIDELSLISKDIFHEKIFRMLGDNPETSVLVGLFNPWSKRNIAYKLWCSDIYLNFFIPWKIGLKLRRLTKEFITEQREELGPVAFTVLYESKFPKVALEALMEDEEVKKMFYKFEPSKLIIDNPNEAVMIGVDVARYGLDHTIVTAFYKMRQIVFEQYSKQDLVKTYSDLIKLVKKLKKYGFKKFNFFVDDTGLGGGVTDMLMSSDSLAGETIEFEVFGINNGSKSINPKRFFNKTAELWWYIKDNQDKIKLLNKGEILLNLTERRYFYSTNGAIKLETKDEMKKRGLKSPDTGDSVSYALAGYNYTQSIYVSEIQSFRPDK